MSEEMLEILDSEGEATGEIKPRDEVHEKELLHPVVSIWIYNKDGELLMQKRSEKKEQMAGCWGVSVAGHVLPRQEPREEAVREVKEELGIQIDRDKLEYVGAYKNEILIPESDKFDNEYTYTFLLEHNDKTSDFDLDNYEVDRANFFPIDELYSDFTSKNPKRKYTPFGEYFKIVIDKVKERLD